MNSDTSNSIYPNEPGFKPDTYCRVGGVITANGDIEYNKGRYTCKLKVRNTGDRPIQVGSHFHFFETNRYLQFNREKAFGMHLNIPASTALRFEPGDEKEVELTSFDGKRRVIGFNGLTNGYTGTENSPTFYPMQLRSFALMKMYGFKSTPNKSEETDCSSCSPLNHK